MCTVIYLPTKTGCLFSSNRDESPARPIAKTPLQHQVKTGKLLCPVDVYGGGTWVGVHEKGHVIILLNGAFIKHSRKIVYRKSRGLVVKELLHSNDPVSSWRKYDLHDIEPFTLIVWNGNLHELVWDGEQKYIKQYDISQPHIWSSSTLYDATAKALRHQWFQHWLTNDPVRDPDSVRNFLLSHSDPQNGFVMNRNELVKTLSISTIEIKKEVAVFDYYELATRKLITTKISINNSNNNGETFQKLVANKIN